MTKGKKKSMAFKVIIWLAAIILIGGAIFGYKYYSIIYQSNVNLGNKETTFVYIPTNSKFDDVVRILYENKVIINKNSFEWVAERKKYKDHIKPGKYLVKADMSNNDLINMLRSGKQEPVKLVFNNIRTRFQLASKISKQIEADSVSLIDFLNDSDYLEKMHLTPENSIALFIPNTYSINWNTSAKEFIDRMYSEFQKFWNSDRRNKAKALKLTPEEVSILASIVQEETLKPDEMPKVAGVYLNRLRKDQKLEADPTVKFAVGDFTIKRILNRHLEIDSPYNTYKYKGLPPGPICLPSSKTIDRVLNAEKHKYIYFCAKEDFSGYHNFAVTFEEHKANAKRYQRELDRRNIKR
ncbi:MAG: endolytic transglycosylase MltG [Bacteroidetes bacterium]|nr:endolytic transglycosylase MltG [Bacteroidota bacterium]